MLACHAAGTIEPQAPEREVNCIKYGSQEPPFRNFHWKRIRESGLLGPVRLARIEPSTYQHGYTVIACQFSKPVIAHRA